MTGSRTAISTAIGTPPAASDLTVLHQTASDRYKSETPPGYLDVKEKDPPGCFGDYIGWRQMLDFAKEKSCPLVLVTDDGKGDWWLIEGGNRTIGPRPELVAEFHAECGHPFDMYRSARFMSFAKKYLKHPVRSAAIAEVENRDVARAANAELIKALAAEIKGSVTASELDERKPDPSSELKGQTRNGHCRYGRTTGSILDRSPQSH